MAISHESSILRGINSLRLLREPLALVAPPSFPVYSFNQVNVERLQNMRFLLPATDLESSYTKKLAQFFAVHQLVPATFLDSRLQLPITQLVAQGLGLSVLPQSFSYNDTSGCRFLKLPYEIELYLNWQSNNMDIGTEYLLHLLFR